MATKKYSDIFKMDLLSKNGSWFAPSTVLPTEQLVKPETGALAASFSGDSSEMKSSELLVQRAIVQNDRMCCTCDRPLTRMFPVRLT